MRISVAIPVLNSAPFIAAALDSVLQQEGPAAEIIVIDGGSTDGTVDVIRSYSDALAYWISEPDSGQSDAINKGLAKATGDFVCWLNADDVFLPGAFAAVAAHPDADWIASPSALLDADGTRIGRCPHQLPDTWLDLACARWTGVSLGPAVFWSRRALERTGELDTSLHYVMDVDYWIRLMRNGLLPTEVQQELAGARTHPGQKSNARHAMAWGIDVMRLNGKLRRGTLNQRERAMLRRYQAWTATRRMPRMIAGTLRARCRRRR